MVVVDSSAIIPLLNIGKLNLLINCFKGENIIIPEVVWNEVVKEGKLLGKIVSSLEENKSNFKLIYTKEKDILKIEGLERTDLAVLSIAKSQKDVLLTNDATMHKVALTQNIKTWWLTALIFYAVKRNIVSCDEGKDVLLELVSTGTHLRSEIIAQALLILEKLGRKQ